MARARVRFPRECPGVYAITVDGHLEGHIEHQPRGWLHDEEGAAFPACWLLSCGSAETNDAATAEGNYPLLRDAKAKVRAVVFHKTETERKETQP